ncbi:MAG: glycosyltransferase, partial [Terriglobia bacterium]
MGTVFFVLAFLVAVQSLVALWDGSRFLRFVRKRLGETPPHYTPRLSLLVPCKGLAEDSDGAGLEGNLCALLEQDYPDYEVLFIVAAAGDPARGLLETLVAEAKVAARVVLAGQAEGRGEKVNNLLAGVAAARAGSEVFVFADSDGRPRRDWLRTLVAHLADANVGAASSFRWYVPTGSFLSGLQSAWNAPIVTYMGEDRRPDGRPSGRNFCWGGGTAIRRTMFEAIDVRRYWAGALSDDYRLTEALRQAGKLIVFVPQCLVATRQEPSWRQLWEWTTRQILITRVYANRLWR